jgi:hypothetical protein
MGLVCVWFACFATPLVSALDGSLEPLDGDLTRVGGLSERDFGWNAPQRRFEGNGTAHFPSLEAMGRSGYSFSVLVIGDSFSEAGTGKSERSFGFQEWIQAALGMSVATIPNNRLDYERLSCDLAQLPSAPRYVVFEAVERYLPGRLRQLDTVSRAPTACAESAGLVRMAPVERKTLVPYIRQTASTFGGVYGEFLARVAARTAQWAGVSGNSALKYQLTRDGLFSNRLRTQLLVVSEDASAPTLDLNAVRATIEGAAHALSATSGATLALMVSPNKLSAYAPYVKEAVSPPLSPRLRRAGVSMVDVDMEIARLIDASYTDVYLPNDTHWGFRGHCAAAFAFSKFISAQWKFDACGS